MSHTGLSRCLELESCALWRILEATRHLATTISVDEILQKTIASALQFFDADRSSVFLYDTKTNELYIKVAAAENNAPAAAEEDLTRIIRFPADMGIAGETAQKRQLINVPDCYADPRFNREVDRKTGYVTRCLISVPLLGLDDALVGVMQVLNKRSGPFHEDDEKMAMILAAHCAVALQRGLLLEERILKEKMQRDLALARTIQMSALPRTMPKLGGYELAGWTAPADETGGDIYDAVILGGQQVALLMADATGHGIGPALSVTQLRSMFRMGLMVGADLGELLSKINRQLADDLPSDRFITAFAGILDGSTHQIHYHSGGQAPLMHYHASRNEVEWLDASAMPLGILVEAPMIAPPPIAMSPGDIFALISDGFFEYGNREEEPFGQDRVAAVFCRHHRESLDHLRQRLCDEVHEFAAGAPQADDMTVVLARRNADPRA